MRAAALNQRSMAAGLTLSLTGTLIFPLTVMGGMPHIPSSLIGLFSMTMSVAVLARAFFVEVFPAEFAHDFAEI